MADALPEWAEVILRMKRIAVAGALATTLSFAPLGAGAQPSGSERPAPGAATPPQGGVPGLSLETVRLWAGRAPGAHGDAPQDVPTLTIFRPDGARPVGSAVIVAPGGGYHVLASGGEGREVADWFAAHGLTAFVLSYRLMSSGYLHPTQLHDAQRAIRWVRAHASEYGLSPDRIGMIGFSAGGHLTAMAETVFDSGDSKSVDPVDRVSSRPDFAILAYAALVFDPAEPTVRRFVGPHATPATVRQVIPSLNVTAQTPPTFIFQTTEDRATATDATAFYDALYSAKVPVEAHIFEKGGHGAGLGMTDPALSLWPLLLQNWLAGHGLLEPKGPPPHPAD
jgi:acetyl esterase/lipase